MNLLKLLILNYKCYSITKIAKIFNENKDIIFQKSEKLQKKKEKFCFFDHQEKKRAILRKTSNSMIAK